MKTNYLIFYLILFYSIGANAQVQYLQFSGAPSSDFYIDVEPGTRVFRTRNWNTSTPNISATGIHTGSGLFETNLSIGGNSIINGKLGIGINVPTRPIEVVGNATNGDYTPLLKIGTNGNAYWGSGGAIELAALNNSGNIDPVGVIAAYLVDGSRNNQTGDLRFLVSNNGNLQEKMRLSSSGNLDVNGIIHTKEVKVDLTGWSDFVFKSEYKLKPLSDLEYFINQNGHLPEVPSESEIKTDGANLGKIQTQLLQKIEELTLYIIDQQKQIDELKKEIKSMKK